MKGAYMAVDTTSELMKIRDELKQFIESTKYGESIEGSGAGFGGADFSFGYKGRSYWVIVEDRTDVGKDKKNVIIEPV
jgi:hypothetical protein